MYYKCGIRYFLTYCAISLIKRIKNPNTFLHLSLLGYFLAFQQQRCQLQSLAFKLFQTVCVYVYLINFKDMKYCCEFQPYNVTKIIFIAAHPSIINSASNIYLNIYISIQLAMISVDH